MTVKVCPKCDSSARAHSFQLSKDKFECWVECDRCETKGETVEDDHANWSEAEWHWNENLS